MQKTPHKIPDTIVVPSDRKPSGLNETAVDGALIGGILADVPGALIGGAVGSAIGKSDMEKEYREGAKVHKPGFRLLKIAVSAVVMGLAVAAVAYFGSIALAGEAIGVAANYAFATAGALMGGMAANAAHKAQEKKYEAAQNYFVRHGGNYEGRDREMQKAMQVTAEENARLNERLSALEAKSFAQNVTAQQQQPTAQR